MEFDILNLHDEKKNQIEKAYNYYLDNIKVENAKCKNEQYISLRSIDKGIVLEIIDMFKEHDIYAEYDKKYGNLYFYWKEISYNKNKKAVKKPRHKKIIITISIILCIIGLLLLLYFINKQAFNALIGIIAFIIAISFFILI